LSSAGKYVSQNKEAYLPYLKNLQRRAMSRVLTGAQILRASTAALTQLTARETEADSSLDEAVDGFRAGEADLTSIQALLTNKYAVTQALLPKIDAILAYLPMSLALHTEGELTRLLGLAEHSLWAYKELQDGFVKIPLPKAPAKDFGQVLIQDFFTLVEAFKNAIHESPDSLPARLNDMRVEGLKFGSLFKKLSLPSAQNVLAALASGLGGDLDLSDFSGACLSGSTSFGS
jgi:hypothetical protein